MPVSQPLADAERALEVARVDVGDEAVLGVVGRGDRLVLVGEARSPARPGRRSPPQQARVGAGRRRARSARRSSPRRRARSPPTSTLRALARPRRRRARRPCRAASSSISGPTSTPSSVPRPTFIAPSLAGQLLGELVGHRLGDVEAVGRRARLADVAHLGDHRALDRGVEVGVVEDEERRVAAELHRRRAAVRSADCSISLRPTSVEPVKDSLRSRGSAMSGSDDVALEELAVMTLSTPAGQPGLLEDLAPARASTAASAARA